MSFLGKMLVGTIVAAMAALAFGNYLDRLEREQAVKPEAKRVEPPPPVPKSAPAPCPVIIRRN